MHDQRYFSEIHQLAVENKWDLQETIVVRRETFLFITATGI